MSFQIDTEGKCKICGKLYVNVEHKWCKPCQMNFLKANFKNWTSGNQKVDDLIQKMQLEINDYNDIVFEWISYNQLKDKEIEKSGFSIVYSAIWKDGPLYYDSADEKYKRHPGEKVGLKCSHFSYTSQNINEFLDELREYSIDDIPKIYGISQNPDTKEYVKILEYLGLIQCKKCGKQYTNIAYEWCKPCQIGSLKASFISSGNKEVDDFIQEMQLKIDNYDDIIFEWIPYNQFSDIEEAGKSDFAIIYSGIMWKDDHFEKRSYKKVALKCLYNSQNITNKFLNKVITEYSIHYSSNILKIYGISQNPYTKDYIMVLEWNKCKKCCQKYTIVSKKWCKPCQIDSLKENFISWTSENKKIDDFIQEMQLKIREPSDIILEWIPYEQLYYNKTIGYVTIWKDGPLYYDSDKEILKRESDTKVTQRCLYFSQNINEILNEVKAYSIKKWDDSIKIYGISQNPYTNEYIIILEDLGWDQRKICKICGKINTNVRGKCCESCQIDSLKANHINWISGNKKIDSLTQQMQLKIDKYDDIVFEWIPYNQFNVIKEIGKGGFATVYSAIWKDGPLNYDTFSKKRERLSNKIVALKCLYNSQNITKEFLNEVKEYSIYCTSNVLKIYGISQNPDTKDYIMVLDYAAGGDFNDWMDINYKHFNWKNKICVLSSIIRGIKEIHQKQMVHCDFHTGNILIDKIFIDEFVNTYISDMGLCGEVGNIDESNIYGVMPYVAPEVLSGNSYTQAADIYSFGMVMYFVATGRQPFANYAHDQYLATDICKGIKPELNEPEAPKCYIDLLKKCWDLNPNNRPNAIEIDKLILLFYDSYKDASDCELSMKIEKEQQHYEIKKQFKVAEEFRKANLSSIKNNRSITHPQAVYTSRLLNPFTKDLLKYDCNNNTLHSECLDCEIK